MPKIKVSYLSKKPKNIGENTLSLIRLRPIYFHTQKSVTKIIINYLLTIFNFRHFGHFSAFQAFFLSCSLFH
ncbi:hypothetical protein D1BOALGB6SA_1627 [Olavius sp. associated proteobacterium Delta 1]|nr:hypothetical protein D1BOALGB6SA_1627 [Olavius sp. associated proteobacterium Delta 1]